MLESFELNLNMSKGTQQAIDLGVIRQMIPTCHGLKLATPEQERAGIDYIAVLTGGREVNINTKVRGPGAKSHWKNDELALEIWSVMPTEGKPGKIGWTLDDAYFAELILFLFHPTVTNKIFMLPFQHLRLAFWRYLNLWTNTYKTAYQHTGGRRTIWTSSCVFVPAGVVWQAIQEVGYSNIQGRKP